MKRLVVFLQQLEFLGGTETVTITLMNELVNTYDVILIVTGREPKTIPYEIDNRIKIYYLNNENGNRMDEKILGFCKEKHYFKAFFLILKNIYFTLLGKYKYRRFVKRRTTKEDILIASSLDNYLIIPRGRYFIYHYHYNDKFYFSFNESFMRHFYRKPDKYVFLDESTYESVVEKDEKIRSKATYISNPIKCDGKIDLNYYNNSLIFVGRFADQKDPIFLIKALGELNKMDIDFTCQFYGTGKLFNDMLAEVKTQNLEKIVEFCGEISDFRQIYSYKDLLLMSSTYEGMPLVINEANAYSIPVVTTNFGKSTYKAVNEENGIIVEERDPKVYAETVYKLLSYKQRLLALKKSAHNHSLQYSKKNIVAKWLTLFDEINNTNNQ